MSKCNCGPSWFEKLMKKKCFFNECCKRHDIDYDEKLLGQYECDKLFLKCMLKKANGKWYRKAQAHVFYRAVRTYGSLYY